MCGHVGIAGDLDSKDERTFERLLLIDYWRGKDSTGVAAIRKTGDAHVIAKGAVHPIDLFDMGKYKTAVNAFQSQAFIGHNRSATKGGVNAINAHPFQCGHIIGCHNGTMSRETHEAMEKALNEKHDVDSYLIFRCIETFGIEETVKLFGELDTEGYSIRKDAWALVWWDNKKRTLNMLRNKERSFYIAFSKDCKKLLWASEHPMLHAAVIIEPRPHEFWKDSKGFTFFPTQINRHYEFELDKLKLGSDKPLWKQFEKKELKAPIRKSINTGFSPPAKAGCPSVADPFGRDGKGRLGTTAQTSLTTTSGCSGYTGTPAKTKVTTLFFDGDAASPWGELLSKDEFCQITNGYCSWCLYPVEYEDVGVLIDEKHETCLCPSCNDNPGAVNKLIVEDFDELLVQEAGENIANLC